MNKQQAIEIIEREPVGVAQFYSTHAGRFFNKYNNLWYAFFVKANEWVVCDPHISTLHTMKPMHEILEIALGED